MTNKINNTADLLGVLKSKLDVLLFEQKTNEQRMMYYWADMRDSEYEYLRYDLPAYIDLYQDMIKWLSAKNPSLVDVKIMIDRSITKHRAECGCGNTKVNKLVEIKTWF